MTLLQKASLVSIALGSTATLAADLPKTVLPDNVILCQPASGCTNKVLLGRNYKVLSTPRFVVMVSISNEGVYTRADVSIANNTALPFNLSPQDFRVEVVRVKVEMKAILAGLCVAHRHEDNSRVSIGSNADDHLRGGLVENVVAQHLGPPSREAGGIVGIDDDLVQANGHEQIIACADADVPAELVLRLGGPDAD